MRGMVPVALVGVLLLSGCAGERAVVGASSSATAVPTETSTPTPTGDPTPTPTATAGPTATAVPTPLPSPGDSATPLENAVAACTTWQASLSQDASTFPATQASAAALMARAAAADATWQPLSTDMGGLVAIGTDTSGDAVQRGQQLFTEVSTRCGEIGVTVNAG